MERRQLVAGFNSAAVRRRPAGNIDPAGILAADSGDPGVRHGDNVSNVHLATEDAADLVYWHARFARGNRIDDGNVSIRVGHDRVKHGGIWTRIRFCSPDVFFQSLVDSKSGGTVQ